MTACPSLLRPRAWAAALAGAVATCVVSLGPVQGEEAYEPVLGQAIDWSILARITETVALDTNRQLDGVNEDIEAQGTVGLNVTVGGQGKRTRFSVTSGFTAGRSTDNEISDLNRFDPNLSATAVFLGKDYSVNASFTGRTRSTSTSELEDSGDTALNATRFDASGSVGVSWAATERDSLTISVNAQFVDFSRSVGTFTPSRTFGLSGSWSRRVSETTSYSFSTSFRHFDSDGVNGRTSRTANANFGIQHQRTSRHTLSGSAGLSLVSTERQVGNDDTQVGFVGGGSFGYQLDEFTAGLSVNQSIQPSSEGDLRAFTSLSGNLGYQINALQQLAFGISYTRRSDIDGGGDVLQFLSLGPRYTYSLTEDSSLSLAYQFRIRDDEATSVETGHQLMLTLSHQLTLLD